MTDALKDDAEPTSKRVKESELDRVPPLKHKHLVAGFQCLAIVKEIHELDMIVSLPNGINGFVSIADISDVVSRVVEEVANDDDDEVSLPSLDAMFHVGQCVRCVVLGMEETTEDGKVKRKVTVSLNPKAMNNGLTNKDVIAGMLMCASIKSVEDHGYVLDFGIEGISGFVNKKNAKGYNLPLSEGCVILCAVTAVTSHRLATCSLESDMLKAPLVEKGVTHTIESLRPGTLVSGKIKKVLSNGLLLNVFGFFDVSIPSTHLDKRLEGDGLEEWLNANYTVGSKVKCRILTWEAQEGGLLRGTLQPSLVNWTNSLPWKLNIGDSLQVKVDRVDGTSGIFVSHEDPLVYGYVPIARILDTPLEKIPKKYAAGTSHPARVLGFDLLDQMVHFSMQPSIMELPFLRISDMSVGQLIRCHVLRIIPQGLQVAITDTIRGLVPLMHLSDIAIKKPEKMFKEGQKISCRVLTLDAKGRRVILTHKKSLLDSPLPPLVSWTEAKRGGVHHGFVTNVGQKGLLVTFYNNVKGWVPIGETSDSFVVSLNEAFKLGQVLRCTILEVDAEEERMKLSLKNVSGAANEDVGQVIKSCIVDAKTVDALQCSTDDGELILHQTHLSDNADLAKQLFSKLKPGSSIEHVLVISNRNGLIGSKKQVFADAFAKKQVPTSFNDVEVDSIVVGWAKSVTDQGVFVAFVNDLVGFVHKANVSDDFVQNPRDKISVGQTVVCKVLDKVEETERFTLSLKASAISESRQLAATMLKSYFTQVDVSDKWIEQHPYGSHVEGKVKQKVPYGVILDIDNGFSGLITTEQLKAKEYKAGQIVMAGILDVAFDKKIADLTLDASLLKSKDSGHVLELKKLKEITGIVEVSKQNYVIVRLPKHGNRIGFVPSHDVNRTTTMGRLPTGHELKLIPQGYVGKRLVLSLASPLVKEKTASVGTRKLTDPIDARVSSTEDFQPGMLIKVHVKSVKSTQVNLNLAGNLRGRIHVSQLLDSKHAAKYLDAEKFSLAKVAKLKPGDELEAKVVGLMSSKTHKYLPLSHNSSAAQTIVEMSRLPADLDLPDLQLSEHRAPASLDDVQVGQTMIGFVSRVEQERGHLWVDLGPMLMGRVSLVDATDDLKVYNKIERHFPPGKPVACVVIGKDAQKSTLDLSLKHASAADVGSIKRKGPELPMWEHLTAKSKGKVTIGRIVSIDRIKGMMVAISGHLQGRVGLTDIADTFVSDPTSDYSVGQFAQCALIGIDTNNHRLDLSLRPSRVGESQEVQDVEVVSLKDLTEGQVIKGYVKSVTDAGCFISLSHSISGRVKIAEMSDDYVKDWKSIVSVGQLVQTRVESISNNRVELTLKKSATHGKAGLTWKDVQVGQVVRGNVTKVEPFGVFIKVENSNISGLCHIARLSDSFVKNISKLYSVGDHVKAIVVEVDVEHKRIAFGLKASMLEGAEEVSSDSDEEMPQSEMTSLQTSEQSSDELEESEQDQAESDEGSEEQQEEQEESEPESQEEQEEREQAEAKSESESEADSDDSEKDVRIALDEDSDLEMEFAEQDDEMDVDSSDSESSNEDPLDVSQGFEWNWAGEKAQDSDSETSESEDEGKKKLSRRAKLRARQENEAHILQREEDLMEHNKAPETADDFERLLLGSPSSSYLWIKYMAMQLHMAEIDRARAVAERALKTINYREEQEKLNVWIAYMNLENTYGTAESLKYVFERAVQVNDPLAVHKQLVNIYERAEKSEVCQFYWMTNVS
jgi:rRNA biogenesis protein RRP5